MHLLRVVKWLMLFALLPLEIIFWKSKVRMSRKKECLDLLKIRIIGNDTMHTTVDRASRIMDIGTDNIVRISEDDTRGLSSDSLEDALKVSPDTPSIVLFQAGELNTGSFDNFEKLIPIAHQYNSWVHIDGAFGLWANANPDYRHYLKGIENADSWATDGHKWLNVPYVSGFAFVAHPPLQIKAMSSRASYMVLVDSARDQVDWNPEFSRRARNIATYVAIRQLGKNGVADLVNRCCKHTHSIVTGIGKLEGAEMLREPIINQVSCQIPFTKRNCFSNRS